MGYREDSLCEATGDTLLVLSFHGWTGSGKNLVAGLVAEAVYRRGLASSFVHLWIATLHFPDARRTEEYKVGVGVMRYVELQTIRQFSQSHAKWVLNHGKYM